MAEVVWSDEAIANVASIERYIAEFNVPAARRLAARIVEATERLAEHPYMGRAVSRGDRILATVYPYIFRYRVAGDRVFILRVRHGAMRRP